MRRAKPPAAEPDTTSPALRARMPDITRRIAQNIARVRGRIADAAAQSGRSADEIALLAITKYVGEAEVRALAEAGCNLLGENRPQALWRRPSSAPICRSTGTWSGTSSGTRSAAPCLWWK